MRVQPRRFPLKSVEILLVYGQTPALQPQISVDLTYYALALDWLQSGPEIEVVHPHSESWQMAGKSKKKLEIMYLVCEEMGDYNYTIRRKSGGEKLKIKKYSPRLRKHTIHNEKKK